jgi:hypothetical protein
MHSDQPDRASSREQSPDPEFERLRQGYIDELKLVNRIMAVNPDEIILHYGNPTDIQGPDAVSIGRHRLITKWDTGWRRIERAVRPSTAAADSLDRPLLEAAVWKEIETGRLPLDLGLEALRSFNAGNYNICTVDDSGEGLAVFVRNGQRRLHGEQ